MQPGTPSRWFKRSSASYIANKWLSDFAYRIELEWWIFGVAALAATLMALLTNVQQSLQAALANPVEALRDE